MDHILLAMPAGREADARKFYQGFLGIPEARKPADLAARGGGWFGDGEQSGPLLLYYPIGLSRSASSSQGRRFVLLRAVREVEMP